MCSAEDQRFRTTSLHLASYLLARDLELLGREPVEDRPGTYVFVFRDRADRLEAANAFLTGKGGPVDVHLFLEAQRRLKNLVHESPP